MSRINIFDYDEQTQTRVLTGHFDPEKCVQEYAEQTRWDGNNTVSVNTDDQWEHERLYRTAEGRWVLHHWSQRQGAAETYRFLPDDKAREWLLIADEDEAVEQYFGKIPDERGPGRPAIGGPFPVRFPDVLVAQVDAAAKAAGISRAAWLRHAAEAQLAAEWPYRIQVRGADGVWSGGRKFTSLTDALEKCAELNNEVPDHKRWKQYRVVNPGGQVMEYQQQ